MGGRRPTCRLCPLEKTKQNARESLLNTCLYVFFWALYFRLSKLGSKPTSACASVLGLHPSPEQSHIQHFISWLVCFLTEKKKKGKRKREGKDVLLATPSAAERHSADTQMSSAGITGDEALPQLSNMSRACASQFFLCLHYLHKHLSLHPMTCWCPLPGFLCIHHSNFKGFREVGRRQAKLP